MPLYNSNGHNFAYRPLSPHRSNAMKKKGHTLEQWALDAGLPRKVAKDVLAFEYDDPASGAGRFIFGSAVLRQIELRETLELQWLFDVARSGFVRPEDFADFNAFIARHLDAARPSRPTPRAAIKLIRQSSPE